MIIKKSLRNDTVTTTYIYNLTNPDKAAVLTRVFSFSTKTTQKDNGQKIEETELTGRPVESVKFGTTVYTLRSYDFTCSNVIDLKPSINYYAGNVWGKKTYNIGAAATGGGTVTVEETGDFYGYEQYWGTADVKAMDYTITGEQLKNGKTDKWEGTAGVNLSSTTTKQLSYVENKPDQISFTGGYLETQHNNSILEYKSKLPEFDKDGVSTDNLLEKSGNLKLESFPTQKRLIVPNMSQLKGHWAEEDIKMLFSLEILKGNAAAFNPEQYISRAEFAALVVAAAKEVPPDPALAKTTRSTTSKGKKTEVVSPFIDVSTDNEYFNQIDSAFKRGLMDGSGGNKFSPDTTMTLANAVTVFIRALGLDGLAPNPAPLTSFKDNDKIPQYARTALYVAEKIGLIQGDDRGYLNPNDKLTKGRAAVLVNTLINYMREGIREDYRERAVNY